MSMMNRDNRMRRGGPKPAMLANSFPLGLTVNFERKTGIYELSSKHDMIARRVELPAWIETDFPNKSGGALLKALAGALETQGLSPRGAESQGHVFFKPDEMLGFDSPAVGIDLEIHRGAFKDPAIKALTFEAYFPGYRKAGSWIITKEDFTAKSKYFESGHAGFMPQMMVPLSALRQVARL